MTLKIQLISLAFLTGIVTQAQKQERSLHILSQGTDARAVAMGGNSFGESTSAFLYGNPTSIFNENNTFSVSVFYQNQKNKATDFTMITAGGSVGYRHKNHGFFLGTRYALLGETPQITSSGRQGEISTISDQTIDVGYALSLNKFSVFASGSYVLTHLIGSASTFVGSVGASYRDSFFISEEKIRYVSTLKISNLGAPYSFIAGNTNQPPTSVGIGGELGYAKNKHAVNLALGATQYVLPSQASSTLFEIGGEYAYHNAVMVRCGYLNDSNGFSAINFGAGGVYKNFRADVSASLPNNNNVSPQITFSVGAWF